ncbi:MAG: L-proline dehydrogenase [Bacteroidota bacterium]|jgi:RHH-type proline utilization regulon transcriptional repressor/proline dehydrogenase/delta 1-pyrroline-5-carboxylate dehydrogenase
MENQSVMLSKVIARATQWQNEIDEQMNEGERAFQFKMSKLIQNQNDKYLLIELLDSAFRSKNPVVVTQQIKKIIEKYGIATFFSDFETLLVRLFLSLGHYFPNVAMHQIIDKIQSQTQNMIVDASDSNFKNYLNKNKKKGFKSNINFLGEAILGENEAANRLLQYKNALQNPLVNYVSIKISTIYSQINHLAYAESKKILVERLSDLYATAMQNPLESIVKEEVVHTPKFINLDMEEFKDLHLTVDVFKEVLSKTEFFNLSAGIVLQAYLPNSYSYLQNLTKWAIQRVQNGGAPIKIRIVKGANMEMEKLESEIKNWPLATYRKKIYTDANYKRMLDFALQKQHTVAVKIGVASHNLFEQAFAYELSMQNNVLQDLTIEMLEGMANTTAKVLHQYHPNILLYTPVVQKEHFLSAIAYLVRRLDENTQMENFLSYSFALKTDSEQWQFLSTQFTNSFHQKNTLQRESYRDQNRLNEEFNWPILKAHDNFWNIADTDWVLQANQTWANQIAQKWKTIFLPSKIPSCVANEDFFEGGFSYKIFDKSNPERQIAEVNFAAYPQILKAIDFAQNNLEWTKILESKKLDILHQVAKNLAKRRGDLIGVATAETGKTFIEIDAEVSEAIDFARFYPYSVLKLQQQNVHFKAKGTVLVISPWNFPIAIPAGGILAALSAGNRVIFKPSSEAIFCAWELCKCFWDAGVPKTALQFIPSKGADVSKALHKQKVDAIIFTGSTDTALDLYQNFPDIPLFAETGGKNATIVTAKADRDQAIKNVLQSAFSNSGQKCSATSLLILEEEVYNDEQFKMALLDAAKSLKWGSSWNFENKMGPLIQPNNTALLQAMQVLEDGESWLLQPVKSIQNVCFVSPSIKWGVQPNSFTFKTELFGPLLAVVCAKNLKDAVKIANSTQYGLTAGLESLDEDEIAYFKQKMNAGNLYINKPTTGAVVLRQAFGGYKKSAVGKGLKAGGLNYVSAFMNISNIVDEDLDWTFRWQEKWLDIIHEEAFDLEKFKRFAKSMDYWYHNLFKVKTDYFGLKGEYNWAVYKKFKRVILRLNGQENWEEILKMLLIQQICKLNLIISVPENCPSVWLKKLEYYSKLFALELRMETPENVLEYVSYKHRLRYLSLQYTEDLVKNYALQNGVYIANEPILNLGRMELLNYFKEQSISHSYHRYGNLMGK